MRTKIFLYMGFLCLALPGYGQVNSEKLKNRERILEKVEAQRVAFITTRLELSSEESAKFWPVYNEYSKKRMELKKQLRENFRQDEMNESDSEKAVEAQLTMQEKDLQLKKSYYEKFKGILPASKIAKLHASEQEFNQEVIKRLKERRQGGKNRPGLK
ncbi:MAG: hypothetical protein M3Q56_03225 [Bacteroidota bacterium]|nr:hypothetical protein [Bacteroidota bacterium]